jgi:Protein of unknown function (DUF3800)
VHFRTQGQSRGVLESCEEVQRLTVIFVDESGDNGVHERSSLNLVLGAVWFESREDRRLWDELHRVWMAEHWPQGEFHYGWKSGSRRPNHATRQAFIDQALRAPWCWSAVVWMKRKLPYGGDCSSVYADALSFLIKQAGFRPGGVLALDAATHPRATDLRIRLTARLGVTVSFARSSSTGQTKVVGHEPTFRRLRELDSKEYPGIQLADWIAGAVAASQKGAPDDLHHLQARRPGRIAAHPPRDLSGDS